jgi:hypothetical protein
VVASGGWWGDSKKLAKCEEGVHGSKNNVVSRTCWTEKRMSSGGAGNPFEHYSAAGR